MKIRVWGRITVALFCAVAIHSQTASAKSGTIEKGSFRFRYDNHGISALANPSDPHAAIVTQQQRPLALLVRYQQGNLWTELPSARQSIAVSRTAGVVTYTRHNSLSPLKVVQGFKTDGNALDWSIDLESTSQEPVTVGDLAIQIPAAFHDGENPHEIFERSFVRHQFISGSGSFLYFVRPSGKPPFLVVTVQPGTKLEYFTRDRRSSFDYIQSGFSGNEEKRATWRQEHTYLQLAPAGEAGSSAHYGFRFRWANSYDELRDVLYQEGLFDVRAVPGMVIPQDLRAQFALRTKAHVDSVETEFPGQTQVTRDGERDGYSLYEASFQRLGENKLTIHHDSGRETYLEFFVTEPLETLIKKRSSFIIDRQQIRDPSKWWDGVFAPYDMRSNTLRTPEDPDFFKGRMSYVLTCDDPGLSKAPYVAAKNVSYPNLNEIRGLEYYLQHFVWGKLQRTGDEQPYPYGVYGTPDWYTNRDPERRARVTNKNLEKMHVWRSYDYPHIVMLYFHMYEIAKKYPKMSTYLDAPGYLERAWQTARAFYIYPYEIFPTYYETYKWGLYNELIVLKLIDALEHEGFPDRAAWLRAEWEKKVKYFVYDDPYPFRSEYAFDRTAFESSYAFAKYGSTHEMKPDTKLWWDVQLKKWYSHPSVRREDSRKFMDRQLAAGLSVRGWVEPSYFQLGADPGLSYMAAMGGWGILDYAMNFADRSHEWLQLGYASYLSSWSLMNTGTPESNYGYWAKGKQSDGAAGWQFMSSKYGYAWMGSQVPRGAWFYDGEIDLGYCGALRMASTVLTRDPLFGWIAYGGSLQQDGETLKIVPRDGLRQRFAAVGVQSQTANRVKIELDRDGFTPEEAIATDKQLNRVAFTLENRTDDAHQTRLRLSFDQTVKYQLKVNGKRVNISATGDPDYTNEAQFEVSGPRTEVEITRD